MFRTTKLQQRLQLYHDRHQQRSLLMQKLLTYFNSASLITSTYPRNSLFFFLFTFFLALLLLLCFCFTFPNGASPGLPTSDIAGPGRTLITGRRFLSNILSLQAVVRQPRSTVLHSKAEEVLMDDQALYCDRSHHRTDVCVAKGDVRVVGLGQLIGEHATGSRVYEVVVLEEGDEGQSREEMIRPYTRKWEESVMKTIDEVKVIRKAVTRQNYSTIISTSDDLAVGNYKRPAEVPMANHPAASDNMDHQHLSHNTNVKQSHQNISKLQQAWKDVLQGSSDHAQLQTAKLHSHKQERSLSDNPFCDVHYKVPAILFSTGGYTGNVYHEFNDGLIPLYITAQKHPRGQVVIILLEYHDWWMTKYAEVIAQITSYPVIDLASDKRVHCFPEVTVGLHIHDELAIHDDLSVHHVQNHIYPAPSMAGFQAMLHSAYLPRLESKANRTSFSDELQQASTPSTDKKTSTARDDPMQPKLVVISRPSPRALLNEQDIISLAKEIGFSVEVLSPKPSTEMMDIYSVLSTCDIMLGVHGAAMTHLLFMRPRATFIQVVPLGMDWAAATYYGEPAEKLGLNYVPYKLRPEESSLSDRYASDDPVLLDPESINSKGWWETKRIYLEGQDVRLSLPRMREVLGSAYNTHHVRTHDLADSSQGV